LKLVWFGVIIVVVGMIVLASQVNPNGAEIVSQDTTNAQKMIGTILDSGAKAVFDPTIAPPTNEFIYKSVEQIIVGTLSDEQLASLIAEVPEGEYKDYLLTLGSEDLSALFTRVQNEQDPNAYEQQILNSMEQQKEEYSALNQTETVIKEIPSSSVELTNADRQLGTTKVCKIGNQCDITGTFLIIDNFNNEIPGPYRMFFSLDCESLEFCNLDPIGINKLTESDGSWSYTTTLTGGKYVPGNYDAFARATIISNDMTYWIEGSMILEVVE
jgi:hypothetical protein